MVLFYSQEDQDIYKNNPFMPRSEYLLKAPTFNTPTVEEEKVTESFGIPNTNAFTNSGGGGGGGNYSGGNFQQVVDARQNRLNKPTDTSTFMGRTMGKVRDFIEPQSANQIMADGYQEPRFQPGIIGTIMGKMDNYRNLPQADQAFIAQNMGYTGPTIFGENNSGLSKDEFGINTRSMFGNYAEYVDKMNEDSKDMTDEEFKDYVNTFKGLKKRKKIAYREKKIEREDLQKELAQQSIDAGKTYTASLANAPQHHQDVSIKRGDYQAQNINDLAEDQGSGVTASSGMHGGKHYAKGGRAGYFFGGRARLQGGGMSQGNQSNIDQSTNMGGGTTGDFSTPEQNMNHREAMRNNQREQSSTLNNVIDTGSELNHLKNLKNFDVPGLIFGFGANKIRNYLGNKKKEDEKLSYNTNALPTNNYTAKLVGPALAQMRTLEKAKGMEQFGGPFSTEQQEGLNKLQQMDQEETIYSQPIFVGANGGRVNFKNGGLASIL